MRRPPLPPYISYLDELTNTRTGRGRRNRQTHKLNEIRLGHAFRTYPTVRKQYLFVSGW